MAEAIEAVLCANVRHREGLGWSSTQPKTPKHPVVLRLTSSLPGYAVVLHHPLESQFLLFIQRRFWIPRLIKISLRPYRAVLLLDSGPWLTESLEIWLNIDPCFSRYANAKSLI
jgi:hypothetical protein